MNEMDEYAGKMTSGLIYADKKSFWGLYTIKGNEIIYERWFGTERGNEVHRYEGHILNNTIFVITSASRMKQGQKTEIIDVQWTYYFRQFSPKPDSTNNFIK